VWLNSLKELRVLAERWRTLYSSLGYRPPAPEAWLAASDLWGMGSGNRYTPSLSHTRTATI